LAPSMVQPANPFAPPNTDLDADLKSSTFGFRMEGGMIVMPKEATLPPLCIRCGLRSDSRVSVRFYWHHPAVYAAFLVNLIVYAIVAAIVRKTALINVPLCDEHKKARTFWTLIGLGVMLAGMV